jgi:hypothetical protein
MRVVSASMKVSLLQHPCAIIAVRERNAEIVLMKDYKQQLLYALIVSKGKISLTNFNNS